MFPHPHQLHEIARQNQRAALAEVERDRLVRHARHGAVRRPNGDRTHVSRSGLLTTVRCHLAAALYALADWLDESTTCPAEPTLSCGEPA